MSKWMIDSLIGWGTVVVIGITVSVATRAPYSFGSTVVYMFGMGLLGIPGGILLGLKLDGWFWPAFGGLLSAAIFWFALDAIFKNM